MHQFGLRALLPLILSLLIVPSVAIADDGPVLNEDGLHHQEWFLQSFMELADDAEEAKSNNKRFAILWELKGCPYCKETHLNNLSKPIIRDFIKKHFSILQLNILGSKIVTDFDGEELSEKQLARKYGVRFTPTVQFFSDDPKILSSKNSKKREVARAQGYLNPGHFHSFFKFVESRAYESMNFRNFLKQGS